MNQKGQTVNSEPEVVICGAGIGGLTAAVALRAAGIATTVLEQAPQLGEVGAGLQIGPNATRVLGRLGLTRELSEIALTVQESVRRRWADGHVLAKTVLGEAAVARYGSPYAHIHRADLHDLLHRAAIDPSRPGPAARIVCGVTVTGVDTSDPLRPRVLTSSGDGYSGDVVIGADGIKSVVRRSIGGPEDIFDSGDMAFRTLIDGAAVKADPATRFLVDTPATNVWLGADRHIVVYPVRDFSAVNIVAIGPITAEVSEQWRTEAPASEMVELYAGWDDRLTALLSKAEPTVVAWALKHQRPFADWSSGNVALLGDACHAMVPYFSQGASQAIEDGAVLAEEIAGAAGAGEMAEALRRYSDRRAERAAAVQTGALNNRALFHLPDGPQQRERDERFRVEHQESDITFDWIYRGTPLAGDPVMAAH